MLCQDDCQEWNWKTLAYTIHYFYIYIYINISVNTDIYTNLNLNLKQCQHHSISILSYQSFWEYSTASAGCDRWGWRLPPLPMDHSLALPPTFAAENSVTVSLSFWDFRANYISFTWVCHALNRFVFTVDLFSYEIISTVSEDWLRRQCQGAASTRKLPGFALFENQNKCHGYGSNLLTIHWFKNTTTH